ncbi:MAG TPA: hypothetical protein VG944_05735 [Fimbriimonas sp.]|nr:hypothetical protein [Fimbriimonas sp.]
MNGFGFPGAGVKVLEEKTDAEGRTWALAQNGVLGNDGDLWLVEHVEGGWRNPLFTGVSITGGSSWAKPSIEPTFAGKTAKELAAGAWKTVLIGNKALSLDSDGDGLTDIEETRLGTDPHLADTDGDGTPDAVDPWPNVSRGPQSEAEQVLAAAFEGRCALAKGEAIQGEGPGLLFAPADMQPFEMPGHKGPIIWVTEDPKHRWSLPLEECYERGVAFISVGGRENTVKGSWQSRLISWSKGHTEGEVEIGASFGSKDGLGYAVKVRKVNGKWKAIGMKGTWVS